MATVEQLQNLLETNVMVMMQLQQQQQQVLMGAIKELKTGDEEGHGQTWDGHLNYCKLL